MKKIGVVANTTKPHAVEVLQNIADISQKLSLDLATAISETSSKGRPAARMSSSSREAREEEGA